MYIRIAFSIELRLRLCSIAQEGERASLAQQQGSELIGCHFLVTALVDKHAHILVNLYLIVKNWFISVFINVFLYRLALSSKGISC